MIQEFRRARRRKVADTITVVDTMTDEAVGRLGNLSETGMLLIANTALVDDALYQLRFELGDERSRHVPIEVGAHMLWTDRATAPGQFWTGLRFICVTEDALTTIRAWVDAPGGQFA